MLMLFFIFSSAVALVPEKSGLPVQFLLYTENPHNPTRTGRNFEELRNYFINGDDTLILIHGHRGSGFSDFNRIILREIFSGNREMNVVVVNWALYASGSYSNSVNAVSGIANTLTMFISQMDPAVEDDSNATTEDATATEESTGTEGSTATEESTGTEGSTATEEGTAPGIPVVVAEDENVTTTEKPTIGVPSLKVHIVGFNLGAHIAGMAARSLISKKVRRITALDPSGRGWGPRSGRLNSTDARYVEVIHTDGGNSPLAHGIGTAIGHVDFFANGGTSQPGCYSHTCCHERAYELFAASINKPTLVGRLCTTTLQISLNTCRGQQLRLGNINSDKTGRGMYRINTGRSFPFL